MKKILVNVDVSSVENHYNPMEEDAWGVGEFSVDEVLAVDDSFITKYHGEMIHVNAVEDFSDDQEYHIARVAWLVKNYEEVNEDEFPIVLSFSSFEDDGEVEHFFSVEDGNHRVSAAIVRGEKNIRAIVYCDTRISKAHREYREKVLGIRH